MIKVACLLNSPELGGAERSFITQLGLLKGQSRISLFVPSVGNHIVSDRLNSFTNENGLIEALSFNYDPELYQFSRSSSSFNLINLIVGMMEQILNIRVSRIFKFDIIWCNGNKVFFPVLLGAILFRYKGKILWHWRDYPTQGKLNKLVMLLYKYMAKFDFVLIGNSDSVCVSLKDIFINHTVERLYNPVIKHSISSNNDQFNGIIGFAGMTAPWKGLHELYLWASLYENDLINSGVKEIAVFGKNIYLTKGDHSFYLEELSLLQNKFPSTLISLKGLVDPVEIYAQIGVMLHLSNKKEPFGRVILESFGNGVPCISTALGGAAELMTKHQSLVHFSYDYSGLTKMVNRLSVDQEFFKKQVNAGLDQFAIFQEFAESDLNMFENSYL